MLALLHVRTLGLVLRETHLSPHFCLCPLFAAPHVVLILGPSDSSPQQVARFVYHSMFPAEHMPSALMQVEVHMPSATSQLERTVRLGAETA
ncbi:hypothetical protein OBBRIDRAFT_638750 [Obba rivulosa]|uniref:Uncharacterized protein n=1 Tax=Obba rivulosa TaxID=1052685 RepID=A0A8E2DJ05_9APHY|nr:hypothetical protein OBBRIDRAFT_638750 [Obba rivulosa]